MGGGGGGASNARALHRRQTIRFGEFYTHTLSPRDRFRWDVRVLSTVFSLLVTVWGLPYLSDAELLADRLWAEHVGAMTLSAVAAGLLSEPHCPVQRVLRRDFGVFLGDAVASFSFWFGLLPMLSYYAAVFRPVRGQHDLPTRSGRSRSAAWAARRCTCSTARCSSPRSSAAASCLACTQSYHVWIDLFADYARVPKILFWVYILANILLNSLNVFWFFKMVRDS